MEGLHGVLVSHFANELLLRRFTRRPRID
jgi:hypothetical protein